MYILERWNKDASLKNFPICSFPQIRKPIKWESYLTGPLRKQN